MNKKCFWCHCETTFNKDEESETIRYANEEHIFPISIGGKRILEVGSVCKRCNSKLGRVDKHLKYGNSWMMMYYQQNPTLKGRNRGKKDRERKEKEKKQITHNIQGTIVKDEIKKSYSFYDIQGGCIADFSYNLNFAKAIHKCAINVVCDQKGSQYIVERQNHYQILIDFVKNKQNQNSNFWPFLVCYKNIFSETLDFEPHAIKIYEEHNVIKALILLFSSAIYIVGLTPLALTDRLSLTMIKSIQSTFLIKKDFEHIGVDFNDYYGHIKMNKCIIKEENPKINLLGNELIFAKIEH